MYQLYKSERQSNNDSEILHDFPPGNVSWQSTRPNTSRVVLCDRGQVYVLNAFMQPYPSQADHLYSKFCDYSIPIYLAIKTKILNHHLQRFRTSFEWVGLVSRNRSRVILAYRIGVLDIVVTELVVY
jgi:hypothetical protein